MAPPDRPVDLSKSTHDTTYFSFGCKNICDCILFLVDITAYFVSSQRIENRWTSDGKRQFSRWFRFKRKERRNGRFQARKTTKKWLFYRLNANSFVFKQFDMLHRDIAAWCHIMRLAFYQSYN